MMLSVTAAPQEAPVLLLLSTSQWQTFHHQLSQLNEQQHQGNRARLCLGPVTPFCKSPTVQKVEKSLSQPRNFYNSFFYIYNYEVVLLTVMEDSLGWRGP